MFAFGAPRPRRRPSMTPMIDVVFLLLVFFMLAARFGTTLDIPIASLGSDSYSGPPRLVDVGSDTLRLNGTPLTASDLAERLTALTETRGDTIVLRPLGDADVQRVVDVIGVLEAANFTSIALVDAAP